MAVHLPDQTLVSDGQMRMMRRWAEAARLAYDSGCSEDGRENLRRLDAFIRQLMGETTEPIRFGFLYGRANASEITLP